MRNMESFNNKKWRDRDGKLIHDGDCQFWNIKICTCGLVHHLQPRMREMSKDEIDHYWKGWQMHFRQLELVPKALPFVEPTKEEMARRTKAIEDVFGKGCCG